MHIVGKTAAVVQQCFYGYAFIGETDKVFGYFVMNIT